MNYIDESLIIFEAIKLQFTIYRLFKKKNNFGAQMIDNLCIQ